MEWIVKNAVSRDVERQHLNKILAEIKSAVSGATVTTPPAPSAPSYVSGGGSSGGSSVSKPITITLTGDVEGEGSGTSTISIATQLTVDVVEEAPVDSFPYWRLNGAWSKVPTVITALTTFDADGFLSWNSEDGSYEARFILGDEEWTTSINSNGFDGDPTIIFTDDAKEGYQRILATASTTVHGQRAVVVDADEVRHPALATATDAILIIGVARTSGDVGDEINVQTGGVMREPSWSWSNGPVYVEDDGVLTQTAPTTGYIVSIGRAIAPDAIDIDVSLALIRS